MSATPPVTRDVFTSAFDSVLAPEDEIIVVHSGLWSFGRFVDLPLSELVSGLIDWLLEAVGPGRTLLMPTYTFSYPSSRVFDLALTPGETGQLCETFRLRQGAVRTWSAINSYAAVGPLARELAPVLGETLWGSGSLMELFELEGARICTLGLPFNRGCSICHRAEELSQASYRYYKAFPGVWSENNSQERPWREVMYVRGLPVRQDYTPINDALAERGHLRMAAVGEIELASALARDIVATSLQLLAADPYVFVNNPEEVEVWLADGYAQEVARLAPEERFAGKAE